MNLNAPERTLPTQALQPDPGLGLIADLIGLLQTHRGASLAALGGLDGFGARAIALHGRIDAAIKQLEELAAPLDPGLWALIAHEWDNTRRHWSQDQPLSNFEIHSFLIDQCHRLLWRYVEACSGGEADAFLYRDMPLHAEALGQLRGLSSYALAQGHQNCESRITQLSRQCHQSLVDTQRVLIRLAGERNQLKPLLQRRVQLCGQFLQQVQAQLHGQPGNAETLFQLGSLALEANQQAWIQMAPRVHH